MRVGTSENLYFFSVLPWDHPHACGDKMARCYTASRK